VLVVVGLLVIAVSTARGQQPGAHDDYEHAVPHRVAADAAPSASAAVDPAGCWDDYVVRAIEVYLNYLDCALKNEWYDFIGYFICELSYEFGALMAMVKFLSCLA
jgi:hypothetical protein